MSVISTECVHNTRLLTLLLGLIFCVKLTNTAHPGNSYGNNVVFMFEEKSQQFKPSCKCHIEGTETSLFHKRFKLEEDGPTYDLCYEGSYVAEITPTEAVCKPCINGTYNPSPNACSFCLICRKCGEHENEVTGCSSTANRICECQPGHESCGYHDLGSATTPVYVPTSTDETKQSPEHRPTPSSTLSSNPQTTDTVTTLPSNENSTCPPCECKIETKWKTRFIVSHVVTGILIISLLILIVVLLRSSHTEYQGIAIQDTPMEEVLQIDNQEECSSSLEETLPTTNQHPADSEALCNSNRKESLTLAEAKRNDISLNDGVIELLVKRIGKDYHTVGIALGLTLEQLEQIDMNNRNDVRDAVRSMLLAARGMRSSDAQCGDFIKAFRKCDKINLANVIIDDAKKRGVDLPIENPENGTDKSLKYPTEEEDEKRSINSTSHSCP